MDERAKAYSMIGKYRAGRRRREARTCEVCGTVFEGIITARFCSNRCRQRAKRMKPVPKPAAPREDA